MVESGRYPDLEKTSLKGNCEKPIFPGDPEYPRFPSDMRGFRIGDDLMDPILPKGSLALLCPDRDATVEDGSLVVALLREGRVVRRCFLYGDLVVLTSMNTLAKPRIVNMDDCRLWTVIGVVYPGHGKPPEEDEDGTR